MDEEKSKPTAYAVTFRSWFTGEFATRIFETEKDIEDDFDTYGRFCYRNWSMVRKIELYPKGDVMGWSGGSELAGQMLKKCLPLIAPANKKAFIKRLFDELENLDWDCQSDLANHPDPDVRKEVEKRREPE